MVREPFPVDQVQASVQPLVPVAHDGGAQAGHNDVAGLDVSVHEASPLQLKQDVAHSGHPASHHPVVDEPERVERGAAHVRDQTVVGRRVGDVPEAEPALQHHARHAGGNALAFESAQRAHLGRPTSLVAHELDRAQLPAHHAMEHIHLPKVAKVPDWRKTKDWLSAHVSPALLIGHRLHGLVQHGVDGLARPNLVRPRRRVAFVNRLRGRPDGQLQLVDGQVREVEPVHEPQKHQRVLLLVATEPHGV
mmetsp:Transcript_3985/g.10030  ORF Transcript_3985/g.10030 Transcript_3985/m.10030 type:complete len:249 (+) Transcript_3985:612-1358(+)